MHHNRQHRLNAKSENQPSSIASTGQFSAQEPQSTQMSALITYLSSPSAIASTGQFSAQEPQLTQASVMKYAILSTSIRIAKEFDLLLTLDHCTDGALIADELAEEIVNDLQEVQILAEEEN